MTDRKIQPSLAELTGRMMAAVTESPVAADEREVEPYEVLNGFRTDPRTAYTDAVLPLKLLGVTALPTALPPEWASFAQLQPVSPAVPMAAGQFPQRVRDLGALLSAADRTALRPTAGEAISGFAGLRGWVKKNIKTDGLSHLAAGVARTLGDVTTTAGTDAAATNERAAGLWLSGKWDEAVTVWLALPDSPVAAFNRGMGLLFNGKPAEAAPHLRTAAAQLPDTSGWSHLAQLYLALAEAKA
jgi:hypothetical protein